MLQQWDSEFISLTASGKKLFFNLMVLALMLHILLPEGREGGGGQTVLHNAGSLVPAPADVNVTDGG